MRIIITGGETEGHIIPAIAISKKLKIAIDDVEILYVGSANSLENKLVKEAGIRFETITSAPIKTRGIIGKVISVLYTVKGCVDSLLLVRKFKPDLMIGTGGYVCGPLIFTGSVLKKKTMIHEQNAYPGSTNRLLSRFVDKVLVSYKESMDYFPSKNNLTITGNPVREEFTKINREESREALGLGVDDKMILSLGGSNGNNIINSSMREIIKEYNGIQNVKIYHVTGHENYQGFIGNLKSQNIEVESNIKLFPYSNEIPKLMSSSDLVISRAGAITLAEITTLGVPSIVIPDPKAHNNHQVHNARALAITGASKLIKEEELEGTKLLEAIDDVLFSATTMNEMKKKSKEFSKENALNTITAIVYDYSIK